MGTDLTRPGRVRVELADPGDASGLADMLQQYLEQTLAGDPVKERAARSIAGEVVFRAAEDEAVCVTMRFAGDRIELRDGTPPAAAPAISGDFLTIAHLTSGEEGPLRLLASRGLRVRAELAQLVLLARVASLLRLESGRDQARRRAVLLVLVLLAALALVCAALALGWIHGGP